MELIGTDVMTTLLLLLVYIFPEVNAFVGRSRLPASRLSCSSRATLCSAAFAAPADGMAAASPEALKVLYDGKCMVCLTNKRVLTLFDRAKTKLNFVNIQDKSYSPAQNGGILFEDAMRHFHVTLPHTSRYCTTLTTPIVQPDFQASSSAIDQCLSRF